MKKLVRSILSGVLAVTILGSSMTAWAAPVVDVSLSEVMNIRQFTENVKNNYISKYPDQADKIIEIVDSISVTEEFMYIFENDTNTALHAIEYSLNRALAPSASPLVWRDEMYYSDYMTQAVRQSERNYCGIASIIMVLIGSGKMEPYDQKWENGRFVPTDDAWTKLVEEQGKIATAVGVVPRGDGMVIGSGTIYLNNRCGYNSSKFKYEDRLFYYGNKGYLKAFEYVIDCLYYDHLPIVRVEDTRVLNYYKNDPYTHYIVVEAVDMQSGDMTILDPHYDDRYYGRHTISFDEFYQIANNGAGIWLSVYTDKGPQ